MMYIIQTYIMHHNENIETPESSYVSVYSPEARRLLSEPISFDTLCEIIHTNRLDLLGRSREQHDRYIQFIEETNAEWDTIADYILCNRFGLPLDNTLGNTDKKRALRPFGQQYIGKLYLLENEFPYHFDPRIKHYCLWKVAGVVSIEEIENTIAEIHAKYLQTSETSPLQITFYVNPQNLRSILEIDHAHIIVYDPTTSC